MTKHKLFIASLIVLGLLLANGVFLYAQHRGVSIVALLTPPVRPEPPAAQTPTATIATPTVTPNIIIVNTPTNVTFTVQISASNLQPGGVNLLRLNASGTQSTILGVMHDDGLNGDTVANDKHFTIIVPFNEATPRTLQLQVSAAFRGQLRRTISPIVTLDAVIQPHIIWAPSKIELTLSPGETTVTDLTFTSDQDLQNVLVELASDLSPFFMVEPHSFATVKKSQAQSMHLTIAVPPNATMTSHTGTVQIKLTNQIIPTALQAIIHISKKDPLNLNDYSNSKPPQIIYSLDAVPAAVVAGVPTQLIVTADIGDGDRGDGPTLVITSPTLLRYDSVGNVLNNYGMLYDDGSHGDLRANDSIFTTSITLLDNRVHTTYLQVLVTYQGLNIPIPSKPFAVASLARLVDPGYTLLLIAEAIDNGDLEGAMKYVHQDSLVARWKGLTPAQQHNLALALRKARLVTNDGQIAQFEVDGTYIVLGKSGDTWHILSW